MDWVDALHETPDLCGEIEVLDYRAIFIGRYSCVYKCRMKGTGELVATKVLNPIRGTGLSTMRRKIERERKTWSSLRHPNILPLYGFADDHRLFTPFGAFISPWRARGDLGEFLIDEGEEASLKVRLHLWQDVVAGVDYLHSHQPLLVHGDLKPGNVLINDAGHAQLCDFGLVRVYLKEGHSGMTTASPHCGTERYLSWELVMAGEDAMPTAASDIYATGCIGLETLFLEKPYSRHATNVRWHMMIDMHAGNPPASRPTNLVGQEDSLWEIISWCWERDPLFRPHARVLCTHVATASSVMEFEDKMAHHWPETSQPSGSMNPHNRFTMGRSPIQLSEHEQSGDMLVYDPDISNFVTAIPSSNGSYDHLSDLGSAVNIHEVGIRGDERGNQGSERNIDLGCTDIEEECSSATYDDGTSLSTSAPILEAPATIRGKSILSDKRLRSTVTAPSPSDPGMRPIIAENATDELLKFASVEPDISRRAHLPPHWSSMPVWDNHAQLKDRGIRDADLERIKVVAPVQSYPFIDAEEPLLNHLNSPSKIEDVIFSSNAHFGSGRNTSITSVYPVASPDTKTLPFNSLAAYRHPDSGMVSNVNQDRLDRPMRPPNYGLSSTQTSKQTDVPKYPSVIPNPSGLRRESGTEISNPVSQSQPDLLPRGSGASLQRRPLPKPPGGIVHQPYNAVESMSSVTLIPTLNQITLTQEGLPSCQSDSGMGRYFRHSRQLSGGPTLRTPAYRRSAMSSNLSKTISPPSSTSTSHSPTSTAPTSGSLDSTPITARSYSTLDEGPNFDTHASTRVSLFANPRSRDNTYSSLELAEGVLIEPSKPATRRAHYPTSLRLDSSGGIEDHAASFTGTNSPKSPVSPPISASNSFAAPKTHHVSISPSSRVAYLSSSPIANEKLENAQLPPASTIPPLRPPRNPARLHETIIGPKAGESNDTMGEQRQQRRGGVFSMLHPKRFSTMWRSRPKSLLLSPLSSEAPPPLEASPSARQGTFGLFGSHYSKEKKATSGASIETQIGTLGVRTYGGIPATGYSAYSGGSTPRPRTRMSRVMEDDSILIVLDNASPRSTPRRAANTLNMSPEEITIHPSGTTPISTRRFDAGGKYASVPTNTTAAKGKGKAKPSAQVKQMRKQGYVDYDDKVPEDLIMGYSVRDQVPPRSRAQSMYGISDHNGPKRTPQYESAPLPKKTPAYEDAPLPLPKSACMMPGGLPQHRSGEYTLEGRSVFGHGKPMHSPAKSQTSSQVRRAMEDDLNTPIGPYDQQDHDHDQFSAIDILDENAEPWEPKSGTLHESNLPRTYAHYDAPPPNASPQNRAVHHQDTSFLDTYPSPSVGVRGPPNVYVDTRNFDDFSRGPIHSNEPNGSIRASSAPYSFTSSIPMPSILLGSSPIVSPLITPVPMASISSRSRTSTMVPFGRRKTTESQLPPLPRRLMGFGDPSVHFRRATSVAREPEYRMLDGDDDYVVEDAHSSSFAGAHGVSESSRSTGIQIWDEVSISTVTRDDVRFSTARGFRDMGAEDSDDGSGAAWLRKRRQQRERERDEKETEERQAIPPGQSATSPRHSLQAVRVRRSSPGISFRPLDIQRKEEVDYRDALGSARDSHTTLDRPRALSSPIHSGVLENGSRDVGCIPGEIYNPPINTQSPTQAVDRDERKEVCPVCYITIRAQNMERHKRSRHPKHFA